MVSFGDLAQTLAALEQALSLAPYLRRALHGGGCLRRRQPGLGRALRHDRATARHPARYVS
ncbi:MAG: hypothetical protein IPG96_07570 [Proteobacteria bacterium]|nr:hypothetical protein [Pseudomonadota bacterium]